MGSRLLEPERRILLEFKGNITNWAEVQSARGLVGWTECGASLVRGCVTLCAWSGITCGGHDGDDVVKLDLSCKGDCSVRLQGVISPELAYLDYLEELDLSHNALSGPLPALWGRNQTFLSLAELNLNDNQLAGPIPETWGQGPCFNALFDLQIASNLLSGTIPEIYWTVDNSYKLLLSLNMANNRFEGTLPEFINGFVTMDYVSLAGNRFRGTIPPGWGLQAFEYVGEDLNATQAIAVVLLNDNQLTGTLPAGWAANGSFTVLRTLSLSNNKLSGPLSEAWAALPALQSLNVSNSGLSGPLPEWGPDPATLETLEMAGNAFIGTIPASWAQLPQLTEVVLQPGNPGLCAEAPPGAAFQLCSYDSPLCLQQDLDTSACPVVPSPAGSSSSSSFSVAAVAAPVAVVAVAAAVAGLLLWRRQRRRWQRAKGCGGSTNGRNNAADGPAAPAQLEKPYTKDLAWLESDSGGTHRTGSSGGTASPCHGNAGNPKVGACFGGQGGARAAGLGLGGLASDWRMDPGELEFLRRPDGSLWQLGSGGFGKVFKAQRAGVQPVAVKVLRAPAEAAVRLDDAAFAREISILRACRDASILQFVGAYMQPDEETRESQLCLVTEFMEGGSLQANLRLGRVTWWKRGRQIALDVARALAYLHSRRLVHLDCKSSNILLSRDGTAKLGDLGMARLLADNYVSGVVGTLAWSAPEMLLGQRCTEKSDVWSYGVCLWEIATGELPVRGQMRDPRIPEECPPELDAIISRCLAADPAARPSAKELVQLLERLPKRSSLAGAGQRPPTPPHSLVVVGPPSLPSSGAAAPAPGATGGSALPPLLASSVTATAAAGSGSASGGAAGSGEPSTSGAVAQHGGCSAGSAAQQQACSPRLSDDSMLSCPSTLAGSPMAGPSGEVHAVQLSTGSSGPSAGQ
ncbi:hypothetical protein ABPG75_004848 [Micractinium tetrahymenae]